MKKANNQRIHAWKTLQWQLTLFVFTIILLSCTLTFLIRFLFQILLAGTPLFVALSLNPLLFTAILFLICSIIATVLACYLGIYYLHPLKRLIHAMGEVKKGNFKVQVTIEKEPRSEMGNLIASFNEMVRELDGIELFRSDFINNFSHEFKTPVVSIRGFARQLEKGDLSPEEQREYAKIIAEEADRLSILSTSILELSKLETQQIITNKREFYLDEQLRQCILSLEPIWGQKDLEIVPDLPTRRIYANEELLAHIWNNLISNAVKFTPQGGRISITLSADEKDLTIVIADTGIGMDEQTKAHIFEKFYQGDPSHHRVGYGIGLTLVKRAVDLCRGNITVESQPGMGSTFTVVLPNEKAPVQILAELSDE